MKLIIYASSTQLKEKQIPSFESWLNNNKMGWIAINSALDYEQKRDLTDFLIRKYRSEFNL